MKTNLLSRVIADTTNISNWAANGDKGKQTKNKMIKIIWQKTLKPDSVSMEQIQPKGQLKENDGKQSVVVDSTAAITNTNNNIENIAKEND